MTNYHAALISYCLASIGGGAACFIGGMASELADAVNVDYRRVGGLRFLKIGRLNFSFSVSRAYRPIGSTR